MSTEVKTGKYNANNLDGYKKKNRFKVDYGSNIFRILPPFASLVEQGVIAKYWAVYWLPLSSGKKRGIPSILQMGKDKRIIQDDPLYQKVEALKKGVEAMKADGTQNPAIVEALDKRVYELNLDKNYYLNAITPSGEIGLLKLRYTAFQALKERLRQLDKDGIDPINVGTGVFFDIKKIKDEKGKVSYGVDVFTKTFKNPTTGKLMTELVEATIDETTLKRMETEAYDLTTLYKVLTPEEQAAVATLDPKVMDRIFARPENNTTADAGEEGAEEDELIPEDLQVKAAVANAAVAAQTPVTPPAAAAPVVTTPAVAGPSVNGSANGAPAVTGPTVNAAPTETKAVNAADPMFNDFVSKYLQTGKAQ